MAEITKLFINTTIYKTVNGEKMFRCQEDIERFLSFCNMCWLNINHQDAIK